MSESNTKSHSSATTNKNIPEPVPLDIAQATTSVWLVKVPKYLATKWNEAPDNSEVGVIRITQNKNAPKAKPEIAFHLNEELGTSVRMKVADKLIEEKIPVEHKFGMNDIGNQAVYILKQSEEASKESLSIIGKVTQRAECRPVQNDINYLKLKKETTRQFSEPKKQIKEADGFKPKLNFLPKSTHEKNPAAKKDKQKFLRMEKGKLLDLLFNAFTKHQYYNIKDLVKVTSQPMSYLKEILHEICKYNQKGLHKNTWELKDEYKQSDPALAESKRKAAVASLSKESSSKADDDYMNDDDDEDDDFEDLDDDDDDDFDDDKM